MKKILWVVIISMLCAWPAAAKPRTVMGSVDYKTQEAYNVESFSALVVQGQIEVEFQQAAEEAYTVSFNGPYNLADLVEIASKNGVLEIHYKEPIFVLGDQQLRVQVSAPVLKRIEIKEAGEIHIHAPLAVDELEIIAGGQAEIEIDELQAQAVRADLTGEAGVEIDRLTCQTLQVTAADRASFDADRADCDSVMTQANNRADIAITGLNGATVSVESMHSSETEIKGRVQTASLIARDRSEINASSLQAENADVMAERSAHIGVRVSDTLNAETQGRGLVEYKGWPKQINRTGKGKVQPEK